MILAIRKQLIFVIKERTIKERAKRWATTFRFLCKNRKSNNAPDIDMVHSILRQYGLNVQCTWRRLRISETYLATFIPATGSAVKILGPVIQMRLDWIISGDIPLERRNITTD